MMKGWNGSEGTSMVGPRPCFGCSCFMVGIVREDGGLLVRRVASRRFEHLGSFSVRTNSKMLVVRLTSGGPEITGSRSGSLLLVASTGCGSGRTGPRSVRSISSVPMGSTCCDSGEEEARVSCSGSMVMNGSTSCGSGEERARSGPLLLVSSTSCVSV
jgi:hypothetical protein